MRPRRRLCGVGVGIVHFYYVPYLLGFPVLLQLAPEKIKEGEPGVKERKVFACLLGCIQRNLFERLTMLRGPKVAEASEEHAQMSRQAERGVLMVRRIDRMNFMLCVDVARDLGPARSREVAVTRCFSTDQSRPRQHTPDTVWV